MIQHLLKSIDYLSYHLKMKKIEHLLQSTLNILIKYFNVLINGKSFFENPIEVKEEAYERVIEMGKNNDYTTGNLLDYEYFPKHYKSIALDLSEQIELENPELKQQIDFIGRLDKNKRQCSLSLKNQTKQFLNFRKMLQLLFEKV